MKRCSARYLSRYENEQLRQKLLQICGAQRIDYRTLAKKIDMSYDTLVKFLSQEVNFPRKYYEKATAFTSNSVGGIPRLHNSETTSIRP